MAKIKGDFFPYPLVGPKFLIDFSLQTANWSSRITWVNLFLDQSCVRLMRSAFSRIFSWHRIDMHIALGEKFFNNSHQYTNLDTVNNLDIILHLIVSLAIHQDLCHMWTWTRCCQLWHHWWGHQNNIPKNKFSVIL